MARKVNLINLAVRLGRAAAADQRRAQNQAVREHNASIRYQNAVAKQNERERKQAERERLAQQKEDAIQYALDRTNDAEERRQVFTTILSHSEKAPIVVDWNKFKQTEPFPKNSPRAKTSIKLPDEIDESVFVPRFGFFDKLFKSRREKLIAESSEALKSAQEKRAISVEKVLLENQRNQENFQKQVSEWNNEKAEFERLQSEHNAKIDELINSFSLSKKDAVEFFFDVILGSLEIPDEISGQWELEYDPSSKILIVDFDLPDKEIIPSLKQMKYVVTRKEFGETFIKEKEIDQIYDEMLLQICLRVVNDLYISDTRNQIESIVFNGIFHGLSKSTGKEETKCIMSLQTSKEQFMEIAIENVDARSCFLKFKGVAGNKLAEFIPVAPILAMDKDDSRFVEAIDVSGMINGMNLAAMDWESFEHLIRELFEKEFATNGAEVRITQASRDGGVDAVMFDPDPIRGGKYVIQAKRYTNVVGVSAVRDLYGTLMNEGAVKGILVTTANYGADSYEFAKDKPITLINGNNLLHMLQKHGYQARIDLDEAKKMMMESPSDWRS